MAALAQAPAASRGVRLLDPAALDEFAYALARMLHRQGDAGHEQALRLVDELVALGRAPDAPPARLAERPVVG